MKIILGIETSCDETAVAIVEGSGGLTNPQFHILSDATLSQTKAHAPFGGVVPTLAKREHVKRLVPLLEKTLKNANLPTNGELVKASQEKEEMVRALLSREVGLAEELLSFTAHIPIPSIDAIAVTQGPGLEPALWVGINFARALATLWEKQIIPTNHMEGHLISALLGGEHVVFPALALLISGGHTELVLLHGWCRYALLGETRDDAVGEAFDKVARILGLPYPGGPEISKCASEATGTFLINLPRPMAGSGNLDFSFSGLKTAVLYAVKKIPTVTDEIKADIAEEFERAVTDVLLMKTRIAARHHDVKTLIVGGGVSANRRIRETFAREFEKDGIPLLFPSSHHSTDNAAMIAAAGYLRYESGESQGAEKELEARGVLVLR